MARPKFTTDALSVPHTTKRTKWSNGAILIVTGAVFLISVILFSILGFLPAIDGKPVLSHMSPFIAQTITTAGIIIPTLLPYLMRTHKASESARDQLENDHDTNLRDENDWRHKEQMKALEALNMRMSQQSQQISWLQTGHHEMLNEVRDLKNADRGQAARLWDLEQTLDVNTGPRGGVNNERTEHPRREQPASRFEPEDDRD